MAEVEGVRVAGRASQGSREGGYGLAGDSCSSGWHTLGLVQSATCKKTPAGQAATSALGLMDEGIQGRRLTWGVGQDLGVAGWGLVGIGRELVGLVAVGRVAAGWEVAGWG